MRLLRSLGFWNVIILVIPRHTEQSSCNQFKMKKENLNKRLLGYKFLERKVSVHHECAYECMFLTACKSINFISSSKTCELNSEGSETVDPSDFVESKRTIFSDITDWPMSMAGGCANHKCGEKKRCFPLGNIAHKCVDITFECPDGFVRNGDSCYYFSNDSKSWTDAVTACENLEDSYLVEIEGEDESNYLIDKVSELKAHMWTGGNDRDKEGTFVWYTSGNEVMDGPWESENPSNSGGVEHCMQINYPSDKPHLRPNWNDDQCSKEFRYICEKTLR